MPICLLAALIAIVDGTQSDASTIAEFEALLDYKESHQLQVLTADDSNDPKLTSTQPSDYVTDVSVQDWAEDPKALMYEFTAAQNQDYIAIRFQANGVSDFVYTSLPTVDDSEGNPQSLNSLYPGFSLVVDDQQDPSDVHIGHAWLVPREAVAGDVYYGAIQFTKEGSIARYLSVKVNIVLPFVFDGTATQEEEMAANPTVVYVDRIGDNPQNWLARDNPTGWATMGDPYTLDDYSITAGDGDTVAWCFDASFSPLPSYLPTFEVLPNTYNTFGADDVCILEWVGQIRSRNGGMRMAWPYINNGAQCFSFKVPMEADNDEPCYAAFTLPASTDLEEVWGVQPGPYYFSLVVDVVGPENFELNEPWLAELPYSAVGFTVEESYEDTTRFWSHWYKRALTGSDAATVTYTLQNGQYAAFSFKKEGVELELLSANDEDSSMQDLIVQSYVIPDGVGFDDSGDLAQEAWPHILYKVPDSAQVHDRYYGKLRIIDGDIERFALVQVVIGAQPILQDLDTALQIPNRVHLDLSTTLMARDAWQASEDWETVSQKITLNLETTIIFDMSEEDGFDLEAIVSPSDDAGLKNAPGLDPVVVAVVEADQYVTTRTRSAISVKLPEDNGAFPPVPTREGSKFYMSLLGTMGDRSFYYTVELSYMRPYFTNDYNDWMAEIAYGRFRNFEHFQYDDTTMHLTSRTSAKYTYLVNRVSLKDAGVFAVSFTDATEISVFTEDDFDDSVNTAAPFTELNTPSRVGYAWRLPSDAILGTVYTVGLTATVDDEEWSGIWEITAVATPMLYETPKKFFSTFPDGAFAFKFHSMGKNHDGFESDIDIASNQDNVAHKIDLWVGQGFSVEIAIEGVRAEAANPRTITNHRGVLLNRESYMLDLHSEVSTKTTVEDAAGDDVVIWSSLQSDATSTVYPSFAWVVPPYAEVGAKLYARLDVNAMNADSVSDSYYYGVFEVTVVEAPQEPTITELVEETKPASLWSTVITTFLIVGLVATGAAFFLL